MPPPSLALTILRQFFAIFDHFIPRISLPSFNVIFILFLFASKLPQPLFASNGIRQRNSSVPLRQVVEKSRSQSTSLLLVANNNVSGVALPSPVGRHSLLSSGRLLDHNSHPAEQCEHCDPHKCESALCAALIGPVNDTLHWARCFGSKKELNKLLRSRSMQPAQDQEPSGCRNGGNNGKEEGEGGQICWCREASSLLAESKERERATAGLHARRRKNHHSHYGGGGMAPQAKSAPPLAESRQNSQQRQQAANGAAAKNRPKIMTTTMMAIGQFLFLFLAPMTGILTMAIGQIHGGAL